MKTVVRLSFLAVLLFGGISLFGQTTGTPIDWDKAKQLYQREQRGEKLSPEDQTYLNKAKEARKRGGSGGNETAAGDAGGGFHEKDG